MRTVLLALVALGCSATLLQAQDDPVLHRIEELAGSGRLTEARATLDRWTQQNPETRALDGRVRAHALLLGARLAADSESAASGYLAVALGYPLSPHAGEALLRLGQGLLIRAVTGEEPAAADRAVAYLQRLVSDYPGSPHRSTAVLWLTRAQVRSGRSAQACRTAFDALSMGVDDPDVDDMLRVEHATWCEGDPPSTLSTVREAR